VKKGFTLIELMIVIAIISLMSSVVLAATKSARDKAETTKAAIDIKTVAQAMELYHLDHGFYPPAVQVAHYNTNPGMGWSDTLGGYLQPYLKVMPVAKTISGSGQSVNYGYTYSRGTAQVPRSFNAWDGATGAWTGCARVYDGYRLSFILPIKSSLTTQDGGIDLDAIEYSQGDVRYFFNPSEC
jgi:type II secretion system protein G